jgi:hypothetical protein
VEIDGLGVVRAASGVRGLSGGEERFDDSVAQNDERGHRSETAGERLVAAGMADAANDVLAAKFFHIISGVAGTLARVAVIGEGADPSGDIGGGEAVG